jgi:hypothetical protein
MQLSPIGEYVIPLAAIILVVVVWFRAEIADIVSLIKRFVRQVLDRP